jgi:hypothetical protein
MADVATIMALKSRNLECSVSRAKVVIESLAHKSVLSRDEESAFRTSVVILVACDFLAPRPWSTDIDFELLRAISMPGGPINLDWAQYTLQVLLDGARLFKDQLFSPRPPSLLDLFGCSIFLYVSLPRPQSLRNIIFC